LVLDFMAKLAAGNYHPAVRVNAILAIGELSASEQTAGGAAAVPLPAALKVLVSAVQSAKLPDAVRAAAMVGILRHAEAGIADEGDRKSLTAVMLRLTAADSSGGSGASGHEWIVAQAIQTLGLLKSVGEDAAVYNAILKTLGDAKFHFCTRRIAAESLGRLSYAGTTGIDAVEATVALGKFADDSCADELGRPASNMTSTALRQRLKQRLDAVQAAIEVLKPLAKEPQRPWLVELQADVKNLSDTLDDKSKKDENMKPRIEDLRKKHAAWLQKKPA
jgi:hypothetical protein